MMPSERSGPRNGDVIHGMGRLARRGQPMDPSVVMELVEIDRERGEALALLHRSRTSHLRDFGREVVFLLRETFAALETDEPRDRDLRPRALASCVRQHLD